MIKVSGILEMSFEETVDLVWCSEPHVMLVDKTDRRTWCFKMRCDSLSRRVPQ